MKRLILGLFLCRGLFSLPSVCLAHEGEIHGRYLGPCVSFNFDASSICGSTTQNLGQCFQLPNGATTEYGFVIPECSPGHPATVIIRAHTCNYPSNEFVIFNGLVPSNSVIWVDVPGYCPTVDDASDGGGGGGGGCKGGGCCGLPVWSVSDFFTSLWLHDEPSGYQPAAGPSISFTLAFKQREASAGMDPKIFSVGRRWNFSWLSYVAENVGGINLVHFPDGRERSFTNSQDYVTNTRLSGDTNSGFTLSYPDGSKDVYGNIVTGGSGAFLKAYMTERWNPQSQRTMLYYTNFASGPVTRLLYVVDGDGRTNTIYYVAANAYSTNLISQVVDPFGRTNLLAYDTLGNLTNITDVATNSASMTYDSSSRVTALTTPYGTTSFQLREYTETGAPAMVDGRSVQVNLPDGGHHLFLGRNAAPEAPATYGGSDIPSTSPFANTFDTSGLNFRNTYHWGPLQYSSLSSTNLESLTASDYRKAGMKHWLQSGPGVLGDTPAMERDPSSDQTGLFEGQKRWFDYSGKTNSGYNGTQSMPLFSGQVLSDGTTSLTRTERNSFGSLLSSVASYSTSAGGTTLRRTNSVSYAADDIDVVSETNALGVQISSNIYNAYHQVATNFNALGEMTILTYNAGHEMTSVARLSGLVTTNLYDANGFLSNTFDYAVIGGTPVYYRTNSFTYTNTLVYTHTDERGMAVTNQWDPLQRLVSQTFTDGSYNSNRYTTLDLTATRDRVGNWTYFGYDSMRRKTAETNALGAVTLYTYCNCGSLDSIQDAAGNLTRFFYDNKGRPTNTVYADGFSVTNFYDEIGQLTNTIDSSGMSTTNWFNNQGLLVTVSNSLGLMQATIYDSLDRATNYCDANGVAIGTTFDNLNRVLTRTYPDGGVEAFGYTVGLPPASSYTNQINYVTRYVFDPLLRETTETNANQEATRFSYAPAGDLLTLCDGNNKVTTWNYDEYGRVTNKVDAASNMIFRFQYDANNRLTNRWTPVSSNTAYAYDAVGNLLSVSYQHSTNNMTLAYDMLNRLTNMVDSVGTTRYTYDEAGQLLSEVGPWADDTVSYTYTNRLRKSLSLLQPSAYWTNGYGYDLARRLTNITSLAGSFTYSYDPTRATHVQKLGLPNGAQITNSFDSVARLLSTTLRTSSGDLLASHSYGVNLGNQRTQQVFTAGNYVNYAYDPVGQLKTANGFETDGATNRLNEQFGYEYDSAGNLCRRTNNALVEAFNIDNLNGLTTETNSGTLTVVGDTSSVATNVTINTLAASIYLDRTFAKDGFAVTNGSNAFTAVGKDSAGHSDTNIISCNFNGTNTFNYDLNGNLLSDGNCAFTYDDENQLTSATIFNACRSEFQYDGGMRRKIRREYIWQGGAWAATNEIHYIYDGKLIIQERNKSNSPQVNYTRGLDLGGSFQGAGGIGGLLARSQPLATTAQTAFYFADAGGNVSVLINTNQLIVARYIYDPFGTTLSISGPLACANSLRFSSMDFDTQTGLYTYLYRYYVPRLARWLTRDPSRERGGVNLYAFEHNQPTLSIDPFGLKCCPDDLLKGRKILVGRYLQAASIMEAAGMPHGKGDPYSCHELNLPVLNFITAGAAPCWECFLERRSKFYTYLGWYDHWAVVCRSEDRTQAMTFDYWSKGSIPGESPDVSFYRNYPYPGASAFPDRNYVIVNPSPNPDPRALIIHAPQLPPPESYAGPEYGP